MNKLKLVIDALHVESFDAGGDAEQKGTVRAHITYFNCNTAPDQTCGNFATCEYATCTTETWDPGCTDPYTCGGTCETCP